MLEFLKSKLKKIIELCFEWLIVFKSYVGALIYKVKHYYFSIIGYLCSPVIPQFMIKIIEGFRTRKIYNFCLALILFVMGFGFLLKKRDWIILRASRFEESQLLPNQSSHASKIQVSSQVKNIQSVGNKFLIEALVTFSFPPLAECPDLLNGFELSQDCELLKKENLFIEHQDTFTKVGFFIKALVKKERLYSIYPFEAYKASWIILNRELFAQEASFTTEPVNFIVDKVDPLFNNVCVYSKEGIFSFASTEKMSACPAVEYGVSLATSSNFGFIFVFLIFLLSALTICFFIFEEEKKANYAKIIGISFFSWLLLLVLPMLTIQTQQSLCLLRRLFFLQGFLMATVTAFYFYISRKHDSTEIFPKILLFITAALFVNFLILFLL